MVTLHNRATLYCRVNLKELRVKSVGPKGAARVQTHASGSVGGAQGKARRRPAQYADGYFGLAQLLCVIYLHSLQPQVQSSTVQSKTHTHT